MGSSNDGNRAEFPRHQIKLRRPEHPYGNVGLAQQEVLGRV